MGHKYEKIGQEGERDGRKSEASDGDSEPPFEHTVARKTLMSRRDIWLWFFHALIALANGAWFVANLRTSTDSWISTTRDLVYSPLRSAVEYRREQWDLSVDNLSKYTRSQGPETDAHWEEISMGAQIGFLRVEEDDLGKMGLNSVPLTDGGYMMGIEVFHQIHCLNYLRKQLYKTEDNYEEVASADHIPHCIDSIRLALQCQADISPIPFKWVEGYLEPWPDFTNKHECRNFDRIQDWAKMNFPDLSGKLVHPTLGTVDNERPLNHSAIPLHHGSTQWIDN